MTKAVYKFNSLKAYHAILHMASRKQPLDLHAALKACYFADKSHLNEYQQPIFGATYKAMKYGPVPLEIYEIMKGEALWLWEIGKPELPWRLDGYLIRLQRNEAADLSELSESEIAHLERGLERSCSMSFTARTAATHGADWQKANGGIMRYEDMLEDGPDREQIVRFIQETARHTRI